MTINKLVKELVKFLAIPVAIGTTVGLSIPFSMNVYKNHNVDYQIEGRRVLKKVDGIFANTRVEIDKDGSIEMTRASLCGEYRSYTDEDRDGYLDSIYLGGHMFPGRGAELESRIFYRDGTLWRDGDLENYPDVFTNGEQDFREQLERFGLSTSPQS